MRRLAFLAVLAACQTHETTGVLTADVLRSQAGGGSATIEGATITLVDAAGRRLVLSPSGARFLAPGGQEVAALAVDETGAPSLTLRDRAGEAAIVRLPTP